MLTIQHFFVMEDVKYMMVNTELLTKNIPTDTTTLILKPVMTRFSNFYTHTLVKLALR